MTREETLERIVEIAEGGWPCEILDDDAKQQIMFLLMQFENTVIGTMPSPFQDNKPMSHGVEAKP